MVFRLSNVLLFSTAAAAVVSAASARLNNRAVVVGGGNVPSSWAPPKAHELDDGYSFETYLAHFNKSYDDADEYDRRSKIFEKNMKKILAHNNNNDDEGGYVMGVNAFTDVESGELPMGYNKLLHPTWRDQIVGGGASRIERLLADADGDADADTDTITESYSKPPDFEMEDVSALPKSVDWSAEGNVNPTVPNQGSCGSCWSFAATATIESHLSIATGEDPVSLSEQKMLQCTPNPDQCGGQGGCKGATMELAFNYVADRSAKKTGGMFNIDDVPYSANDGSWGKCKDVAKGKSPSVGIEGWTGLESNNYKAVMNALAKAGPLAIAVSASSWGLYESGVWDSEDTTVNHAVLLVGYGEDDDTGEKFWKVRNSWGPRFGEDGYIRIKRTDDDDKVCGMDNDPLVGMACALDDKGNTIDVKPAKVCGTGAVLFDAVYPVGAFNIE